MTEASGLARIDEAAVFRALRASARREGKGRKARLLEDLEPALRAKTEKMVRMVKEGRRDVYR